MRVIARGRGWMRLQGERETACSSCIAKSGCGVNAISDVLGLAPPTIAVACARPAEVGAEVAVSIPGGVFLRAALLAYLLPPAALVIAAAVADSAGLSGGLTALIALAAFALSLLPIRALDRDGRLLDTVTTNTEPPS